jgi:hypothetical protein
MRRRVIDVQTERGERHQIDAAAAGAHTRGEEHGSRLGQQRAHTPPSGAQRRESDVLRAVEPILAAAADDDLVEIIARANAALPDTDRRKILGQEVDMLRRLASQARAFNANLVQHASERRAVGERRGHVSPESANTAAWAGRLADALEALIRYKS